MNITIGHLARHTPPGAGAQGRDAAIVDVAQDLFRDLDGRLRPVTASAAGLLDCSDKRF